MPEIPEQPGIIGMLRSCSWLNWEFALTNGEHVEGYPLQYRNSDITQNQIRVWNPDVNAELTVPIGMIEECWTTGAPSWSPNGNARIAT